MRARSSLAFSWIVAVGCYQGTTQTSGETEGASGPGGTDAGPSSGPVAGDESAGTSAGTPPPGSGSDTDPDGSDDTTAEPPPIDGPLLERLVVTEFEVPEGVAAGVNNWRIWGTGPLHVAPMFTTPRDDCGTLVGFTTGGGAPTPRVAVIDASDALVTVLELPAGLELRGLAAEPGPYFGALLWDDAADRIWIRRYDLDGVEQWSSELTNADNDPTDFGIGDSRLEYGAGTYGAYYHVHSHSGHEGDTLKWVAADTGAGTNGWGWGCSHSMSNLLRYNPALDAFMPACVTDCFPGTSGDFSTNSIGGIYLDHNASKVMDVDAGCNGSVAGELGGAALGPGGWSLVFNAHQAPATLGQSSYDPATMNQDIGFSAIAANLDAGAVVWLTDTPGVDEDDASIARWQPSGDDVEQYLVGWHEPGDLWHLARVDAAGSFLEGPVDVSGVARWGRRDDPFRAAPHGDVVWSWFESPGSTTLRLARVQAGQGSCE